MTMFALGTEVTLSCRIRDVSGNLVDPTEVTCTVNGVGVTVQNPAVGVYAAVYLPPALGEYVVVWRATGNHAATLRQRFVIGEFSSIGDVLQWLPDDMTDDEKEQWADRYSNPHKAAGMAWQSWAARLKALGKDISVSSVSTGAQSINYGAQTSAFDQAMATAQWHFARCYGSVLSPDYGRTPDIPLSEMLPPTWSEIRR